MCPKGTEGSNPSRSATQLSFLSESCASSPSAGPSRGLPAREGLLVADLDLAEVVEGKFDFDVAGHYARPDVFRLQFDETPRPVVERASFEAPAPERAAGTRRRRAR